MQKPGSGLVLPITIAVLVCMGALLPGQQTTSTSSAEVNRLIKEAFAFQSRKLGETESTSFYRWSVQSPEKQIRLSVHTAKTEYQVGEEIIAEVLVQNIGDDPIQLYAPGVLGGILVLPSVAPV